MAGFRQILAQLAKQATVVTNTMAAGYRAPAAKPVKPQIGSTINKLADGADVSITLPKGKEFNKGRSVPLNNGVLSILGNRVDYSSQAFSPSGVNLFQNRPGRDLHTIGSLIKATGANQVSVAGKGSNRQVVEGYLNYSGVRTLGTVAALPKSKQGANVPLKWLSTQFQTRPEHKTLDFKPNPGSSLPSLGG